MSDQLYIDDGPDAESEPSKIEKDLEQIQKSVELGKQIEARSPELAAAFRQFTCAFLDTERSYRIQEWAWEALHILDIGDSRAGAAIAFVQSTPRMRARFPGTGFREWKSVGYTMAKQSNELASTYFALWPDGLKSLYVSDVKRILDLAALIAKRSPENALAFYRSAPRTIADLNPNVRESFAQTTLKLSSSQPEAIAASFAEIASALLPLANPAQEHVMALEPAIGKVSVEASSAYFQNVEAVLSEITEDFLDQWVEEGLSLAVKNAPEGIEYFKLESAKAHEQVSRWKEAARFDDVGHLLAVFAHALTGREMSLTSADGGESEEGFASRRYSPADGQTIFLPPWFAEEQTRQANFRLYKVSVAHHAGYVEFGTFDAGLPAIRSFVKSFPHSGLASDIFFILEDGRIDQRLKQEYAGLSIDIDLALSGTMSRRPFPHGNALTESLETLLRLSVGLLDPSEIFPEIAPEARFMKETLGEFYEHARHVTDSLSKTAEIYQAICHLLPEDGYVPVAPLPHREHPELESGVGSPVVDADEVVPANEKLSGASLPMTPEELKKLLEQLNGLALQPDRDGEGTSDDLYVTGGGLEGDEAEEANAPENRDQPINLDAPRTARQLGPFFYDEWDHLQDAYRKRWCCLTEEQVPANAPGLYSEIYDEHNALIQKVRRQFQQIRPQVLATISRVNPGDELDFPSLIQSVVNRKAGGDPSEKIFSRKDRTIRRISTLLLIDMSASTSQDVPSMDTPPRRKRIIDIEIETLVVMTEALEALDDEYAIFGFSGQGRHSVDFYAVKDFNDPYCEDLKRRIGGITPKQGTRMGPAIRHAIEKLRTVESDHRLMILVSDGFPQDTDYGEDRRSKEYGLHDTKMALIEARKAGIRPFCITVDKAGNDYLRKMCDPTSYLVAQDIHALPEVLPKVVESLMV